MTVEHLKRPIHYMNAIAKSEQFLSEERSGHPTLEVSFGRAALGLSASEQERGIADVHSETYRLIGLLPSAVEAQRRLNDLLKRTFAGEKVDQAEREFWIRDMIAFNESLRHLLAADPEIGTEDMVDLIESAVVQLYPDAETASEAIEFTRRRTQGMQHEVIADTALSIIPGVTELKPTTVEDEIAGIDRKVMYNDRLVNLDIKSTKNSEVKAKRKGYKSGDVIPVWTGIQTVSLNGSTQVDPTTLLAVANRLKAALESDAHYQRR